MKYSVVCTAVYLSWEAASQNELPAAADERVDPLKTVPFLSLLLVKSKSKSASTCS